MKERPVRKNFLVLLKDANRCTFGRKQFFVRTCVYWKRMASLPVVVLQCHKRNGNKVYCKKKTYQTTFSRQCSKRSRTGRVTFCSHFFKEPRPTSRIYNIYQLFAGTPPPSQPRLPAPYAQACSPVLPLSQTGHDVRRGKFSAGHKAMERPCGIWEIIHARKDHFCVPW